MSLVWQVAVVTADVPAWTVLVSPPTRLSCDAEASERPAAPTSARARAAALRPREVAHGWGYLSKTSGTSEETLLHTIRAAAAGHTVLDPALLARVRPRAGSDVAQLTQRQYEVLRLVAEGLSNSGVAERLGITEKSVQNHLHAVYSTLGIDSDPARNPRVSAALRLLEGTGPVR